VKYLFIVRFTKLAQINMKIVGSIATIIEGIETLTPNKEMPDIIDKVEENNSTHLLAAITKQKQA
jgi:hypothetical protein